MAASRGQNGIRFAVQIVKANFGELVAKVCECLLRRGSLNLPEIVRYAEVTATEAKNSLLILIQHNCVQAYSAPRGSGDKMVTFYTAIFDGILNRIRFPKFMIIVKDDLGAEAEELLEGLLQNGRLSFDQLADRRTAKFKGHSKSRNQSLSQEQHSREQLRIIFNELVNAHYIERCPRPEPFLDSEEQTGSSRRRKNSEFEPPIPLEELVISAAAPVDVERFRELSERTMDDTHLAGSSKRKHEDIDQGHPEISQNEILWRANYEKFLFCIKKKICIENVRSTVSLDAGNVLEAMIEVSGKERFKDGSCVSASIGNIYRKINENPGSAAMMMEHIKVTLEQIGCLLISESEAAPCTLDLKCIIEDCQNREVETLVKARYGQDGYRVFRALAKSGKQEETEKITLLTILEGKVVNELLFKMWKDKYVRGEKLMKEVQGHNEVWLWKIDKSYLREHMLDTLYHAAFNLSQMIALITAQQHEFGRNHSKLKATMTKRYFLFKSFRKLDDSLVIFS